MTEQKLNGADDLAAFQELHRETCPGTIVDVSEKCDGDLF